MKKDTRILINYLKINNIDIDEFEFNLQLNGHPEFPKIISYSDTLHFFNIGCSVYEISKKDIVFLPENFLSLDEGGDFKLEKKDNFDILPPEANKIIILVDKYSETHYEKGKYNFSLWGYLSLISLIVLILIINTSFLYKNLFFLSFSFFGIFLSYEAYKKTHGKGTLVPVGVCQNKLLKTDCDHVFNYKKWDFFDISEISLSFFFSQIITFIAFSIYQDLNFYYVIYQYIYYLFIPVSIVSLYYQIIVIKKLCPICIGIIFCVYAQLSLLLFLTNYLIEIKVFPIIFYIFFILISILFLLFLREINIKNNKLKEQNIKDSRFRKNYVFFKNNLSIQKKTINDNFLKSFNFGINDSKMTLTLVTNPSCKYCKEFYPIFMRIITQYKNKINIYLVLDADLDAFPEEYSSIYLDLACIYENHEDKNTFFIALNEWYELRASKKGIEKWSSKYSHLFKNQDKVVSVLDSQKRWRKINDINYTPDIFINGYQYPLEYERNDLEYFLSEMIE